MKEAPLCKECMADENTTGGLQSCGLLPRVRSYPGDVFRQGRRWVTGGRARAQAAAYTLTSTYGSGAAKVNQCNHPKMRNSVT